MLCFFCSLLFDYKVEDYCLNITIILYNIYICTFNTFVFGVVFMFIHINSILHKDRLSAFFATTFCVFLCLSVFLCVLFNLKKFIHLLDFYYIWLF